MNLFTFEEFNSLIKDTDEIFIKNNKIIADSKEVKGTIYFLKLFCWLKNVI